MRSPWGRTLKGIREDEDAVRSLGKNVFSYKMQALVLGGVLAAAGGIVYALPSAVSPGVYVTSLTFCLDRAPSRRRRDGVRSSPRLADLLGAPDIPVECAAGMAEAGWLFGLSQIQAGTLRFILVGVALMLLVIFMPQGLLGNKKELTFVK